MIRFALACGNDHAFEAWFSDNASYDEQVERGLVSCPECGSTQVGKAVMAPSVRRHPAPDAQAMTAIAEARRMARSAEDLGAGFPAEARRIHDGTAPSRPIRGRATSEEAASLLDEGIGVFPMPDLN